MTAPDGELVDQAGQFASTVATLIRGTVAPTAEIDAVITEAGLVVGAPLTDSGRAERIPLNVDGQHRLDLRVQFTCSWDSTEDYLAIDRSEFALLIVGTREPLVRFDFVREQQVFGAHINLHAESSALGWLQAYGGATRPNKVQDLHLPVGGRRFRPSIEDVIEFAIIELGVDALDGWPDLLADSRATWEQTQAAAVIRDVVRRDPRGARAWITAIVDKVEAEEQRRPQ